MTEKSRATLRALGSQKTRLVHLCGCVILKHMHHRYEPYICVKIVDGKYEVIQKIVTLLDVRRETKNFFERTMKKKSIVYSTISLQVLRHMISMLLIYILHAGFHLSD